jgi:flagellar biosynthetic protein FliR
VFSLAGKLVDVQSGLGIGSVFDPVSRAGAPLFSTLFGMFAVALFYAGAGLPALVRAVGFSLEQVPPGSWEHALRAELVVRQFGLAFSYAVALAAPVLAALLLLDLGLAVASRLLPHANVLIVLAPAKLVGVLLLLLVSLPAQRVVAEQVFRSLFQFWSEALA